MYSHSVPGVRQKMHEDMVARTTEPYRKARLAIIERAFATNAFDSNPTGGLVHPRSHGLIDILLFPSFHVKFKRQQLDGNTSASAAMPTATTNSTASQQVAPWLAAARQRKSVVVTTL